MNRTVPVRHRKGPPSQMPNNCSVPNPNPFNDQKLLFNNQFLIPGSRNWKPYADVYNLVRSAAHWAHSGWPSDGKPYRPYTVHNAAKNGMNRGVESWRKNWGCQELHEATILSSHQKCSVTLKMHQNSFSAGAQGATTLTAIRLRSDYDVSRRFARLLPFDVIRREQKMNMSIFRRSRIAVESQLWYRL